MSTLANLPSVSMTPSPTPSPVTVTINYSLIDHTFTITVKGATHVSYLLKYFSETEDGVTLEAITHSGQAEANRVFTATHLAGTESAGEPTFHTVTTGGLELSAVTPDGQETQIFKTFTVNEQGVIKVTDVTAETLAAMVLGTSTESATLDQEATGFDSMMAPLRTVVPANMTNSNLGEVTLARAGLLTRVGPLALLAIIGIGAVLAGIWWQRRRDRIKPTTTPPDSSSQPPTAAT